MAVERFRIDAPMVESGTGWVHVVGPANIHVSMTPIEAAKVGMALVEKAAEAIGKKAVNEDCRRRNLRLPYPDE